MDNTTVSIHGNVTLDECVAIAPGVLLLADPDSQLIIEAGVCIGMGSILHAQGGILHIAAEASLGSRVLVVGAGKIGVRACIGSHSTLYNCSIEAEQVVPSNHFLGDNNRQVVSLDGKEHPPASSADIAESVVPDPSLDGGDAGETQEMPPQEEKQVYGLTAFNQLMIKLFPYRDALNQPLSGDGDDTT